MSDTSKKAWEQIEGEPNEAYARFLVYRNLGVARTVQQTRKLTAKNGEKGRSGTLERESVDFKWAERASAWDIEALEQVGRNVVVQFVSALEAMALKTLTALNNDSIKPGDWEQVLKAVNTLGSFIPAETVEAVRTYATEHRISAIGTSAASTVFGEHPDKAA